MDFAPQNDQFPTKMFKNQQSKFSAILPTLGLHVTSSQQWVSRKVSLSLSKAFHFPKLFGFRSFSLSEAFRFPKTFTFRSFSISEASYFLKPFTLQSFSLSEASNSPKPKSISQGPLLVGETALPDIGLLMVILFCMASLYLFHQYLRAFKSVYTKAFK